MIDPASFFELRRGRPLDRSDLAKKRSRRSAADKRFFGKIFLHLGF